MRDRRQQTVRAGRRPSRLGAGCLLLAACASGATSAPPGDRVSPGDEPAGDPAGLSGDDVSGDARPGDQSAGDPAGGDAARCVGCWRSALYPPDWRPGVADGQGRSLQDYSYAGYRHGQEPPYYPPGPAFLAADYGADPTGQADATQALQDALDAAVAAGGGLVLLGPGLFRCDGLLVVDGSSVVLRGAGPDWTQLAFTRATDMSDRASLTFAGAPVALQELPLLDFDGEAGSAAVHVADASALRPGMDVAIGWTIGPDFVAEHGMDGYWQPFWGQWKAVFRRQVARVDTAAAPDRVWLDVPLRYPAKRRDGASVRVEAGYLRAVGVEDLALSNAVARSAAWAADRAHVLLLQGVADAWVRNVRSFASPWGEGGGHLQSGGLKVLDSKRVTISDVELRLAQNRGEGGDGYLFELSRSNEVLVRDCAGHDGRHNFIVNWDFGTSGCVFLRIASSGSATYSAEWQPIGVPAACEYHHALAIANLVDDSLLDDGWWTMNRLGESSGAGHTATQGVFWNVRGAGLLISYQYGDGFVIGPRDLAVQTIDPLGFNDAGTAPEDLVERGPPGLTLDPPSLYEDQRRRRLGPGE